MEPVKDNEDIILDDNIELPVDPDAQAEVEPNFADIGAGLPEEPAEPKEPQEPDANGDTVNNNPGQEPQEPQQPDSPGAEPSSLNNDDPAGEPVQQSELSEESVMEFLSKQLGKEVTSLDDLKPEPVDPYNGDEDLKSLAEWRERTGRPLSDWVKYQKDYGAMSDEAAAREYLQHKYPEFTADEIQLELEQYIPSEDDLDNESARKRLNLKKLAADGRRELDTLRLELDKALPAQLTKEQQTAIEYYQTVQEQQANAQKIAEINGKNLDESIQSIETLGVTLDKDNSIEFKPPPENRKNLKEFMKMPNWYNKDNTLNAQEVVKDSYKLQNFDAIVNEAFKQGLAQGQASIEKEVNNKTLDEPRTTDVTPNQDDIIIEGLEDFGGPKLQWK